MVAQAEVANHPTHREANTLQSLISRVPEAISFAKLETEASRETKTPEGKFALTYLLATRNILRPAFFDLTKINDDLMRSVGGPEYNPERTVDEIGVAVANNLIQQTTDIPKFWIRIEESGKWQNATDNAPISEGERFAVIDPLDMTSSILKNSRTQTTGIAIYDKAGKLMSAGIMSLVDDGFIFVEKQGDTYNVFPDTLRAKQTETPYDPKLPIRVSTLTRRMHALKDAPLFKDNHAEWQMDCTSGYAILQLIQGNLDAVVDPFKGNPWYENVIWYALAQTIGYPVTDKNGKPLDFAAIMQSITKQEISNGHRIPAVVSRSPEIHARVLSLLAKSA